MGVIKETKLRSAVDPSVEDRNAINDVLRMDDQESANGDVLTETESEAHMPVSHMNVGIPLNFRVRRALRVRTPAVPQDTTLPPRRRHGTKKWNRYENLVQLTRLAEEPDFGEVSIEDLVPSVTTGRAFARFLEEADMAVREHFMHPEDDPNPDDDETEDCSGGRRRQKDSSQDPEEAFQGICRKLRNILKRRQFPLGLMEVLEENLLDFFCERPDGTFESSPLDAFRRSMLHAVSQYNSLRSYSSSGVKSKEHNRHKQVHVLNENENGEFSPMPIRLVDYLESKYHAREQ